MASQHTQKPDGADGYDPPVPASAVGGPGSSHAPTRLCPEHLYKAVGLAFLAALFYRFFDEITRVLLTIYAAAILAVAFNIVVGLFPRQRRWTSAALGLLVLGAIGVTLWLGVPALADQLRGVADRVPDLEGRLQEWSAWLQQQTGLNVRITGERLQDYFQNFFGEMQGGEVLGRAWSLLDFLILPLLILVGGLYAVSGPNDRLLTPLLRVVPRNRRPAFRRVLELLGIRLRGWVAGTLISMLIVGVLTTITLHLLGAPYALLLGTLNGVLEFVPIVGPFVGGGTAVLVTFLDSPSLAAGVLIAVLAIQQLESNVITPIVMSKAAEVHPFITVFAIFLFGGLFGFLGILLALPLVLLLWTVVEVLWVERAIDTDEDTIEPVVHD